MRLGGVIRRAGFDRVTVVAGAVTVAVSLALVAAGPVYSDAVTVAALRADLADLPPSRTTITVETRVDAADVGRVDDVVRAVLARAIEPTGGSIALRSASGAFDRSNGSADPADELTELLVLRSVEAIDEHATLVAGVWPSSVDTLGAGVAVDERVAASLGVDVGDRVPLSARGAGSTQVEVEVVGRYRIDADDPFWATDDLLADGVAEGVTFRTHALVADLGVVLEVTDRPTLSWFAAPDLGAITVDDVEPLRRRVAALPTRLDRSIDTALGQSDGAVQRSPIEVDTGLPGVLDRSDRSLTVTRSSVLAVTLQLSVLAGYALMLVAGLVTESRAGEYEVLRARGASPRQLLGRSAAEAAVLVVPAAVVAPWVASGAAAAISRFGPLAASGLVVDPRPVRAAWIAVFVAGFVTVALLAWPTYRQARAGQRAADGVRQRSRSSAQRAGVDVAIAVFAAVAVWQLGTLGDERVARLRGRFGVDPLLVVAPALGLFAGAFLALRIVPLVARLAERLAVHTRSAVPALAGWQVSRRPARYARSALLLILAVALGVFATTYQATWERSQVDQARHQAGADLRVQPNRRTNDSITDLHLRAAYEQVPDVRTAMPVVRRRGVLPNSELPADIVVLDAAAAADVVLGDAALAAAWPALADGSGRLPAAPVADGATAIELTLAVTEQDDPPDDEPAPVLDAAVLVVVSDAHGLLHRLPAGAVSSADGPTTLRVDLDLAALPRSQVPGPLGLVDVEVRAEVPADRSRSVLIEVLDLVAVAEGGDRVPIVADGWTLARTTVGPLDEFPGIADARTDSDAVAAAVVVTGRAAFGASSTYGIRPAGEAPPGSIAVLVSRAWFEANERSIGDPVRIDALADVSGRIVGTVEAFPTIDPDGATVVVVDLATLEAATYSIGASLPTVDEMWLDLVGHDGDRVDRDVARTLVEPPYEAVATIGNDELAADLLADPPAVGTIGALSIGFVAAAVLAVVGFLVAAVVSARDRAGEFALLRALGLTGRQLAAWTFLEQAALIVLCSVIGTGVGLGLSALVLPAVSSTAAGGEVYPPVEVVEPWTTIIGVQLIVLAGLVVTVLAINVGLRRLAVARQLRAGAT